MTGAQEGLNRPRQQQQRRWAKRAHTGFNRTNGSRKCPVCGSAKWCQVTKDDRLAHCMYVSSGSVRVAADGGFIHVLNDDDEGRANRTQSSRLPQAPTTPLAPLYVRHAAYERLIELSPAWSYEQELVLGRGGLRGRGLPTGYSMRFGALPPEERGRDLLATKVEGFLRGRFPDYAEECAPRACVIGVPGFWRAPGSGQLKLGTEGDKARPALVIPYKDGTGAIQACQLRVSRGGGKKRYRWLSTGPDRAEEEPEGSGSGSPLHWTFAASRRPDDAPVVVTEGALKAEVFAHHAPDSYVIATAGVGNSHEQILGAATGARLLVGFDRDHRENLAVCRQMARLISGRYERREPQSTNVLLWDGPKGIDDAAQSGVRVADIAPVDWYWLLSVESRSEVEKVWKAQDELSVLVRSRQSSRRDVTGDFPVSR